MNSYLIVGGTSQDRLDKLNLQLTPYNLQLYKPHPDILSIQPDPSVRIRHIREAQRFLSRKPYQGNTKAVVISEAEKMTIPAQNAFLKTLEEPPEDSLIFLCSPNEELLLPTIVSRCEVIKITNSNNLVKNSTILNTKYQILNTFLQAKVGERLKLIEPYEKTREEAIKFCEDMIGILREELIKEKKSPLLIPLAAGRQAHYSLLNISKSLQSSLLLLKANVNVKLVLDNLVIYLNGHIR